MIKIINRQPATGNWQPATDNRQPTTGIRQLAPATDNPQPDNPQLKNLPTPNTIKIVLLRKQLAIMTTFKKIIILIFCSIAVISCGDDDDENITHTFTYDFEEGTEGWTAGFSDYPSSWDESRFDFRFEHTDLPGEVDQDGKAILLSGRNISDDLFMFIKKQLTGLKPDHNYLLSFRIELASQYPEGSVGVGGSPGGSVFLKAGGSAFEPLPIERQDQIRMNIDKGGQSQGGDQMKVLGTVGIEGEDFIYTLIQRDNLQQPLNVRTDSSGNLWVIVGTDSGFEAVTTLYYNSVEVRLQE